MKVLTAKQSYQAMFRFLEQYYRQTNSADIGILLGSMQLLNDGLPADSAIWKEWEECIMTIDHDIKKTDSDGI